MIFLTEKINLAGGEEVAEVKVPQAWKRYCLGPQLIQQKQEELRKYENELKEMEMR